MDELNTNSIWDLTSTAAGWNNTPLNLDLSSTQNTTQSLGSGLLDSVGGLQGLAGIGSVIGNIWGGMEQRKYQKDLLKMEKQRIARDRARQDKFDAGMTKAWA